MTRGFLLLLLLLSSFVNAEATDLRQQAPVVLGSVASYYAETHAPLALEAALAAYQQGNFTRSSNPFLNFGIAAPPHWVYVELANPGLYSLDRVLSIEAAWLDQIDLYLLHDGKLQAHYSMGDRYQFPNRPINSRFFTLEHSFLPGTTQMLMRVDSPDPMLIPMYLSSRESQQIRYELNAYSYGLLYGVMLALLLYNLILYTGIRHRQYLLYAVYLLLFVLLNLAYTGHGFRWLWPESVSFQQWANPVLMILYAISGLVFALSFLNIRASAPKLYRHIQRLCILIIACLSVLVFMPQGRQLALYLAFTFILLGAVLMLLLGLVALRAGNSAARYFLSASVVAALGGMITALSVWGLIPYSLASYRAVDLGTVIEAILLALALAEQFRQSQRQRLRAEEMARLDPLTGLNNRRAFAERVEPLWLSCLRHERPVSLAIIDLDDFKKINDTYGHKTGDLALELTAKALNDSIRAGDVLARWGGEEFILFMPETGRDEALLVAERLRRCVADLHLHEQNALIEIRASVGVAARSEAMESLEQLIYLADECLYTAKTQGRNQVVLDGLS